jgi:hypothetical protein
VSAEPIAGPDTARSDIAVLQRELAVLEALVRRQPIRWIAKQYAISKDRVGRIGTRHGHPDREAMRRSAARLRTHLAHLDAGTVPEPDDPAVEEALRLSAAGRDLDPRPFAALYDRPIDDLVRLITVCVGIIPPDTPAVQALDWADAPPESWTDETVTRESARWLAGARDRTAIAAREQSASPAHSL